ncbi:putative ABC transporter ATP-binding protein AlbC [compost metagenome]
MIGLASRAPLTILDEPYLGLDAANRAYFYSQLIEDYASFPRTFILSTHLIDEVSDLLEHILVIDDGKLLLHEEVEQLQQSSFYVSGSIDQVNSFIDKHNCHTIHAEILGDSMTVMASGSLTKEMRSQTALTFAPVPLQKLIVHTTRAKRGKKGVKLYDE